MGRKSLKEPRQKEIINAFYKLAKKEGLENASVAKTAELIDMNPSLVMHYFKTKEQMVYGLVEHILDKYLLIFKVPAEYNNDPQRKLMAVIDNIFSNKWNKLFDDGVSYSCYSLNFRDATIKEKYKILLDTLRQQLEALIATCNDEGILTVTDTTATADLIFILADGAYYYLSLVSNKKEFSRKLNQYKLRAIHLLHFNAAYAGLKKSPVML